MKRTQIYLDEDQDRKLAERAKAAARTKSDLVRDAVDRYLDGDTKEARVRAFRESVLATVGAISRLPSGEDYVEAVRAGDRARDEALDRQWHGP